MSFPIYKVDDVRIFVWDMEDGYYWIYDVPIQRLPPLEKFILENYKLIGTGKYPRAGYVMASHIA